jgi:hypothetical protein
MRQAAGACASRRGPGPTVDYGSAKTMPRGSETAEATPLFVPDIVRNRSLCAEARTAAVWRTVCSGPGSRRVVNASVFGAGGPTVDSRSGRTIQRAVNVPGDQPSTASLTDPRGVWSAFFVSRTPPQNRWRLSALPVAVDGPVVPFSANSWKGHLAAQNGLARKKAPRPSLLGRTPTPSLQAVRRWEQQRVHSPAWELASAEP